MSYDYKKQLQDDIRAKLDQHKDWLQKMKEQEGDDYSDGEDVEYVEDYVEDQYYQQENEHPAHGKPKSKRWDQLYELNKLQKETREYMRKALEEEKDEDPECTFHPKISEMSQKLVQKNRPDFIERNNLWLNQRKEKIKNIGDSKEDKELLHCTFEPQLNRSPPPAVESKDIRKHHGVDRFLERQEAARRERQRKKAILNGSKSTVRSKAKKKMTIPKNPKLSAYQTQQRGRKIKEPKVKSRMDDNSKREIEEMYRDPDAIYPKNVSLYDAVMTLHEHLNSFEISFE